MSGFDTVVSMNSELVFEGTTEEIVHWLLRNITDGCCVRNSDTGEQMVVSEFISLYIP